MVLPGLGSVTPHRLWGQGSGKQTSRFGQVFARLGLHRILSGEAKAYLPADATVRKDVKRDSRWQIRAPYWKPSVSVQFLDRDVGTDNQAFLICVRQAWKIRVRDFGERCPFDLDASS